MNSSQYLYNDLQWVLKLYLFLSSAGPQTRKNEIITINAHLILTWSLLKMDKA